VIAMWKNTFIAAAFTLSLGACATHPAAQSPPAAANTATQKADCGPGTVSSGLIHNCGSPGRTYTQEQLRRTGVVGNTAQALRQLDPSITLH
jgi:hypothetical protein